MGDGPDSQVRCARSARRLWKKRFLQWQDGSVIIEFALCLIPLLLLIVGVADFGDAWLMEIVVSNASREGARYATRYQVDPGTGLRKIPSSFNPSVAAWVTSSYASLLPSDANLHVPTPTGAGYTTGTAGADVTVTVTAQKHWFVLNKLLPGLSNPKLIRATTTMKCE